MTAPSLARCTPLANIQVGMRLRSTCRPEGNQAIVTALTEWGFAYRIPDDEVVINPHWSMVLARDGHEVFAVDGMVWWEPVLS